MSVFLVASSPPLKSPKYLPNRLLEEIPNVFLPLGNVSAVSTKKKVKKDYRIKQWESNNTWVSKALMIVNMNNRVIATIPIVAAPKKTNVEPENGGIENSPPHPGFQFLGSIQYSFWEVYRSPSLKPT